ncbi:MAG: hypothetical protein Kow0067_11550 [Coriobacteriia bacterium]
MHAILTRVSVRHRLARSARIICALFVVAACALGAGCADDPPELERTRIAVGGVPISVRVADTEQARSWGLQGLDGLAEGTGMLFVYDDAADRTFAMKDVSFPIDVLFIGEDGRVSGIVPLDPGSETLAFSPGPSRYVVELPRGWAEARGIRQGSRFELEP